MGWVESPKFLYDFAEILTDVANALVDTEVPVMAYGAIAKIPSTKLGPSHTCKSLTHIYCYMDDVISAVQGDLKHQHRVFDGTVRALQWLLPSLPVESK